MSDVAIMDGISGERLADAIVAEAQCRQLAVGTFVQPLTSQGANWVEQLRRAAQPRPATVARVRALITGATEMPPAVNAGHRRGRIDQQQRVAPSPPMPASTPIDREPCWYCGVRGDIGCSCRGPSR